MPRRIQKPEIGQLVAVWDFIDETWVPCQVNCLLGSQFTALTDTGRTMWGLYHKYNTGWKYMEPKKGE